MKRRHFLSNLAAGLGTLPFLPEVDQGTSDRLQRLSTDVASASGSSDLWLRVREEFQLNPGLTHLN